MAVTETLARGITIEINTGTYGSPTWVEVGGLTGITPTASATDADTRHMTDGGNASHIKASRSRTLSLTGHLQSDPDTGDRDAGQVAVELYDTYVGHESLADWRVTKVDASTIRFYGSVVVTSPYGGGQDNPDAWSATITVSGAITNSATVAVPGAPTSVAGTEDDAFSLITWTESTGSPEQYNVRVLAGSTEVANETGSAATMMAIPLTNDVEYTAQVRARNAGGWGAWSTASSAFTPTAP